MLAKKSSLKSSIFLWGECNWAINIFRNNIHPVYIGRPRILKTVLKFFMLNRHLKKLQLRLRAHYEPHKSASGVNNMWTCFFFSFFLGRICELALNDRKLPISYRWIALPITLRLLENVYNLHKSRGLKLGSP